MTPRPAVHDVLRPSAADALSAWAARVRSERAQTDRAREVADPADFYAPTSHRFRFDPDAGLDAVGLVLEGHARPGETWLDVGAGGGRYTLPIARLTRGVTAVDPSPSMLAILREGVDVQGLANVRAVEARWPVAGWDTVPGALDPFRADVSLMAHVGYDIEEVGPFLDAFEAATRRLCIAVMGEAAMTTVGRLYWERIHGEPRVPLPALPDLVTLLLARGRLPEVRLVDREPPTHEHLEGLHDRARRQLWLRPGSDRDARLGELLAADSVERDAMVSLPEDRARIGIVTWEPR
ncbi:MAG: methyltransferase domain-containing protein [Candidatus Limnocylindrales bacterium]